LYCMVKGKEVEEGKRVFRGKTGAVRKMPRMFVRKIAQGEGCRGEVIGGQR